MSLGWCRLYEVLINYYIGHNQILSDEVFTSDK